jgi:hypothetical protein
MIQLTRRLAPTPETPNSQENIIDLATNQNKMQKKPTALRRLVF